MDLCNYLVELILTIGYYCIYAEREKKNIYIYIYMDGLRSFCMFTNHKIYIARREEEDAL